MADEAFLSRWSRRKAGRPEPEAAQGAMSQADATANATVKKEAAPPAPEPKPAVPPPLTLDDVTLLTPNSDFSRFVARGTDPSVRNAAMKKLFADPHFNVMDGLDTYIDDYGRPDPIPTAMLRAMYQSAALGLFRDDDAVAANEGALPEATTNVSPQATTEALPQASTDGGTALQVAQSSKPAAAPSGPPDPYPTHDDDADLRLQQDDAAERPGAGPRTRG